jgi:uncharacterized RDD family membrane protein YckC
MMSEKKLKKLRFLFVTLILLLVLSAFIIPYTLLSSINIFGGSFLYWTIFALLVILLTIKITTYWRE